MEVRYTLSKKEIASIEQAIAPNSVALVRYVYVGIIGAFFVYIFHVIDQSAFEARLQAGIVAGACVLMPVCLSCWAKKSYASGEADGVNVPVVIKVTPDGVTQTLPGISVAVAWSSISGVEFHQGFGLLRMNARQAFGIPTRFFEGAAQALAFAEQAETYMKAAQLSAQSDPIAKSISG